ncbi:MAG: hypothetical protein BWX50_01709 [Euryarchaeota archaeon ADurb.Bin009]|nr:MAG: hypothetical protein BWX50_01709 [Euryarchaeota archaeon ADurb.Bin009]
MMRWRSCLAIHRAGIGPCRSVLRCGPARILPFPRVHQPQCCRDPVKPEESHHVGVPLHRRIYHHSRFPTTQAPNPARRMPCEREATSAAPAIPSTTAGPCRGSTGITAPPPSRSPPARAVRSTSRIYSSAPPSSGTPPSSSRRDRTGQAPPSPARTLPEQAPRAADVQHLPPCRQGVRKQKRKHVQDINSSIRWYFYDLPLNKYFRSFRSRQVLKHTTCVPGALPVE